MSQPIFRPTRSGDEAQLLQIWESAFVGASPCARAFFDAHFRGGSCMGAALDDLPVSAIYLLEGLALSFPHMPPRAVTYLYALGTHAAYRCRGLGGKTIRYAGEQALRRGADFVCFQPATAALAQWYREILSTTPVFSHRRFTVTIAPAAPSGTMEPISPARYAQLREALLQGCPHVRLPQSYLALQRDNCALYAGGLYLLRQGNAEGICALDVDGEHMVMRELLAPDGDPIALAQLPLHALHCRDACVRTPAFFHTQHGVTVDDCVVIPCETRFPQCDLPPYWGLTLD